MTEFTNIQQEQVQRLGISPSVVQHQLKNFIDGFPFLSINRPAIINDGIIKLSDSDLDNYISHYDTLILHKSVLKFVPASGAASRMFKELFAFVDNGSNSIENNEFISKFIHTLSSFAFYDLLNRNLANKGEDLNKLLSDGHYLKIVNEVIGTDHLNFGGLPKGLLPFHAYKEEVRTSLEEHFAEGAMYAKSKGNIVNLHFTVAPEHQLLFEEKVAQTQAKLEAKFGVTYHVSYSQQLKSTDTLAVTLDNKPFVEADGSLLFRPAGHGALLENLNTLDADLIFIKNIDNVVPDGLKSTTVDYKKALAGILLTIQKKVHDKLNDLTNKLNQETIESAKLFIQNELFFKLPPNLNSKNSDEQLKYLISILNRPIRVCGMVENKGEPGGGPFFVDNSDGSISLQIAETSQLDLSKSNITQKLEASTHFNPVDLVCAVNDINGKPFNLMDYRDDNTGFITHKSKDGRELKAQELPGLWNGAMANWITLFVEVPLITFNPVKTVNDLLKPTHQP